MAVESRWAAMGVRRRQGLGTRPGIWDMSATLLRRPLLPLLPPMAGGALVDLWVQSAVIQPQPRDGHGGRAVAGALASGRLPQTTRARGQEAGRMS